MHEIFPPFYVGQRCATSDLLLAFLCVCVCATCVRVCDLSVAFLCVRESVYCAFVSVCERLCVSVSASECLCVRGETESLRE